MDNPIKYSDLIQPDDSIDKLIKQLDSLDGKYSKLMGTIKDEAKALADILKKTSGATEEGQEKIPKAVNEAAKLKKAEQELAHARSENAKKLIELKQAKSEQTRIDKLLLKLNQSAEGSYNKLSAQYSLNKIRLNAMSDAERKSTESGKQLEKQTKELYDQMKKLQEATGKFQLNVGNYPQLTAGAEEYAGRLKDVLGLSSSFGESLLNLGASGQGLIGIIKGLGTATSAFAKTLFGLIANPVFVAIAGIGAAAGAVKFWYDYNKGLIEATRLTQQFTDKSGADLKQYRNEVQAVADIFNEDFKEVLIATNALSKQFGISSEQALKLIKDGFVSGANASGEFLDSVKEYPAYFKEAGISADQFVAIIAQTTKAGIFSDKGIDAIKEANLRLREMTKATADALDAIGISSVQVQKDLQSGAKTTFQVMQEVSAKLNELPESASVVGTAIADIFGGPGEDAGLQYLKTLKDISLNLDDVKSKSGEFSQQQEKLLQSEVELNNVISAFFDNTSGGFEKLTIGAKILANDAMRKVLETTIDLTNWFIRLYNDSLLFKGVIEGIKFAFKEVWSFFTNFIGNAIDKAKAFGKVIHGAFTLDLDEIRQGYAEFSKTNVSFVKNMAKDFSKNLNQAVNNINSKVKEIKIPVKAEAKDKIAAQTVNQSKIKGASGTTDSKNRVLGDLRTIESEKSKIVIDAEKYRLSTIKALNIKSGEDLKKIVKNNLEQSVNQYRKQTEGKNAPTNLFEAMGLKMTPQVQESIMATVQYTGESLNTLLEMKTEATMRAVELANMEVDSARAALDKEIEARNNGYANNVLLAQKELDNAKKNQDKALREQQKAQKMQSQIQTIQQIGNMVTASSLIWSQLGFPWAIPAIAAMWVSFAATKIKAAQMAKSGSEKYGDGTIEMLEGGSHASGNDIDLGRKKDGTRRRAEGGEYFAIINKRNSRKYRSIIPDVINSLNNGSFAERYMNAYNGARAIINVNESNSNLKELSDDVRQIRQQGEQRTMIDGRGNVIVTYKNLRQTIKN